MECTFCDMKTPLAEWVRPYDISRQSHTHATHYLHPYNALPNSYKHYTSRQMNQSDFNPFHYPIKNMHQLRGTGCACCRAALGNPLISTWIFHIEISGESPLGNPVIVCTYIVGSIRYSLSTYWVAIHVTEKPLFNYLSTLVEENLRDRNWTGLPFIIHTQCTCGKVHGYITLDRLRSPTHYS